jgi:hypothetical protein
MSKLEAQLTEVVKISLAAGDVLVAKLCGDAFTADDMDGFKALLDNAFPNNKVLVMMLPSGYDLKFETLAPLPKPVSKPALCSDPISFCDDCSCGKKQALADS